MNNSKTDIISTFPSTPHKLVISEKPSVARSIAAVLGAAEKHDGYLTGNGYIVSWCVGHLVSAVEPEAYDERYKKWRYADLPIIPSAWQYKVTSQTRKQYEVLKKLMHSKEVSGIVCATDAGREGELIFRLVYAQAGCKLPVERLWISSLEQDAIRQGFAQLRSSQNYDLLYQAALCREHADWLVGMNATRLYSLLHGRTLKIGRVMSPTLAMIVGREDSIRDFKPEKFYTVQLDGDLPLQSERFSNQAEANSLCAQCSGQTVTVTSAVRKQKSEKPPQLYDLTTLQRDANHIFGYTAQQTLTYTQALYEKRLVTYPRTDSRFLTHDMEEKLPGLVGRVAQAMPFTAGMTLPVHASQVINDPKVSDHHAIIPTLEAAKQSVSLLSGEQDILTLIAIRLLCAVSEPYLYEDTTVIASCAGHDYTAKGRTTIQMGWKACWYTYRGSSGTRGSFEEEKDSPIRADLQEGTNFIPTSANVTEGTTTAPKRFTDGSILAAMERAGSNDLPDDAERKGIGTPATRAAILEKLVADGLIARKGNSRTKQLVPTEQGAALVAVLPEQLQSPLLTAQWEQKLKQIEYGEKAPNDFMQEISNMLTELKTDAQRVPNADALFPSQKESLGKCPNCGATVLEAPKGFFCENQTCRFGLWKDNRFLCNAGKPLTQEMMKALLRDGEVKLIGLKSKQGKRYDAKLIIDCDDAGQARIRTVFN